MKERGLTKRDSLCLKGIAIIMLLLYHLFRKKYLYEDYNVNFSPFTEEFATSIIIIFKICVSIFAFITGYGLLTSIKGKKLNRTEVTKWNITRLLKTMSGFYFIYIIVFIVTMVIDKYPMQIYLSESTTAAPLYMLIDFLGLSNLFETPTMLGAWWYMTAAIIFILLVPIIYTISKKVGYLPVIFVVIMLPRVLGTGYPGGINLYPFILCLTFGMIFADYGLFEKISDFLDKKKIFYVLAFCVLAVIMAYYYLFFNNVSKTEQWELEFAIFPVFVIVFCRYFIIRIPGIKQILAVFGKYSMNMYLIHNFMRHMYLKEFLFSFENFLLIFLVLFVLSFVMAVAIDLIKKLVRYDKLIDKINEVLVKQVDKLEVNQ